MITTNATSALSDKYEHYLLLAVIACTCLAYSHVLIDYALLPRLLVIAVGLCAYYLYALILHKKHSFHRPLVINRISVLLLLFIVLDCSSLLWCTNYQFALISVSKKIITSLLGISLYSHIKTSRKPFITTLCTTIAIIAFISSIFTCIQIIDLPKITHNYVYRITGIHGHKNLISSFNYLCLVISCLAFYKSKTKYRILLLISIAAQLCIMCILQCRGVYLALIIFALATVFLIIRSKTNRHLSCKYRVIVTITTVCLINVFFLHVLPRCINHLINNKDLDYHTESIQHNSSIRERLLIWDKTYELIDQNPWFGVGSNNWQIEYPKNELPNIKRARENNTNFQRPHNDFLWILSENGIIGFNLIIIFIVLLINNSLKQLRGEYRNEIIITLGGFIGYMGIAFVSYPLERIEHATLLAIIVAILLHYSSIDKNSRLMLNRRLFSYIALGLCLTIATISFAWCRSDFHMKKVITNSCKGNKDIIANCNEVNDMLYACTPFTIPVEWYKGNTYVLMKDYKNAYISLAKAKEQHPYHASTLSDYASALYMVNKKEEAIENYKKALAINPDHTETLYNLIKVLVELNHFDEAGTYLHHIKDPNYLEAYKEYIQVRRNNSIISHSPLNK